jgi:hypothetical protein
MPRTSDKPSKRMKRNPRTIIGKKAVSAVIDHTRPPTPSHAVIACPSPAPSNAEDSIESAEDSPNRYVSSSCHCCVNLVSNNCYIASFPLLSHRGMAQFLHWSCNSSISLWLWLERVSTFPFSLERIALNGSSFFLQQSFSLIVSASYSKGN